MEGGQQENNMEVWKTINKIDFKNTSDLLKNLKDLCAEFLIAVELLLDLNNTKRENLEVMIDVDGAHVVSPSPV